MKGSALNRQPSNQYAWAVHLLLGAATCLWLFIARRSNVSFEIIVVVAAAITLCGGFVTSIRANGVFRRGQRAVERERAVTREREAEFDQLIFSLPALFAAFYTLEPDRSRLGPFQMHEFANWLRQAVCHTNVVDWMMRRPHNGRRQMLRGLTDHIPHEYRQAWEHALDERTESAISEMRLYYQHGSEGVRRGPQRKRQDDERQQPRAARRRAAATT